MGGLWLGWCWLWLSSRLVRRLCSGLRNLPDLPPRRCRSLSRFGTGGCDAAQRNGSRGWTVGADNSAGHPTHQSFLLFRRRLARRLRPQPGVAVRFRGLAVRHSRNDSGDLPKVLGWPDWRAAKVRC